MCSNGQEIQGTTGRDGRREAIGEIEWGGDPHLISALRKEGGGGDGGHFNVHSRWTEII